MYLLVLTILLSFSYFVILFVFSYFFKSELPKLTSRSFRSVIIIAVASIVSFIIAGIIPDPEISNRVLHGLGGGVIAFLVCFLAMKDSNISINKFQFFVMSSLIVTALGVGNEIAEFCAQSLGIGFIFSATPFDTWLDLVSNTVGLLIAAVCFVPFVSRKE
jgi:hypothetical protein